MYYIKLGVTWEDFHIDAYRYPVLFSIKTRFYEIKVFYMHMDGAPVL